MNVWGELTTTSASAHQFAIVPVHRGRVHVDVDLRDGTRQVLALFSATGSLRGIDHHGYSAEMQNQPPPDYCDKLAWSAK